MVAMICELRRTYPRWGAQRIAHELTLRGVESPPSRSSVYRISVRHGLIAAQQQNHKRKYRRWQRDAPMQLWQIDIMGGVFLADGRECKLVTGIDDHARFAVMTTVVAEPSARSVCAAFTTAWRVPRPPKREHRGVSAHWKTRRRAHPRSARRAAAEHDC
jgi:hypothetical protein